MHTLLFYDPGHFHAALTLRSQNPRTDPAIHVYANEGPDLDAFLALIRSFNERAKAPTRWTANLHTGENALQKLIDDRHGDIAILAGRNDSKLQTIRALHGAGIHALVDKPWITTSAALPLLNEATAGPPLALDIMTSRHDVVAQLRRRIVATDAVFGEFAGTAEQPDIEITSLHHLCKIVNGAPLQRPPWYYDVAVQGDGLVDIQTHMVDQTQWLIDPEDAAEYDNDVILDNAERWTTNVPLSSFTESTGAAAFPDSIADQIVAGELQLACNGQIDYRLKGVRVRQRSEWALHQPAGGGDLHSATVRGSGCGIVIRQGPETGYVTEVHVTGGDGLEARLSEALPAWRESFPGLDFKASELGFEMLIPAALNTGHEAHFAMVLDEFLDLVETSAWPEHLARRIRNRYTLTASARDIV